MTGSPRISVVVPIYNHLVETQEMLDSLLASVEGRDDVEVVMNDDGSTDGTREWLDTLNDPRLRVLKNPVNLGFSATCNAAVRASRGQVLVLGNNDLVYGPNWLEPMLRVLDDPALEAGVVGNVQFAVNGDGLDHVGVDVNYRGQLDHMRQHDPAEAGLAHAERFAVTAACCMLRRDLFDAVQGLDERYVNGCEDMDLCFKVAARGLRHYVALTSVVRHHVSLTRSRASLQNERNSALLYREWGALLEARTARRWLDRLTTGAVAEPSDGCDELGIDPTYVTAPEAMAVQLARCHLQRNERHRNAMLSVAPAQPEYASIAVSGVLYRSILDGYTHLAGELHLSLPAGVGVDGFFVCGHLYVPPAMTDSDLEWWALLEVNGCQRHALRLPAGDFTVGFNRPLMWDDAQSSVRFRVEQRDRMTGEALEATPHSHEDVFLRHISVDNHLELPLRHFTP
jgi:GT2 family glycosyltransferase